MTLNYCGRGSIPGTVGPAGTGGSVGGRIPVFVVPDPPIDPPIDPPYIPWEPPPTEIRFKCIEEISNSQLGVVNTRCVPCDGIGNNPGVDDRDCFYLSLDECELNCVGASADPDPPDPDPTYKCEWVAADVCPESLGLPLNEATILAFYFDCVPCVSAGEGCVSLEECQQNCLSPVYTGNDCEDPNSEPVTRPTTGPTTGGFNRPVTQVPTGPSTGGPSLGGITGPSTGGPTGPSTGGPTLGGTTGPATGRPTGPSTGGPTGANEPTGQPQFPGPAGDEIRLDEILSNSITPSLTPHRSVTTVSIQNIVEEDDYSEVQQRINRPKLFNPELNFFKTGAVETTTLVSNNFNSTIFKQQIPSEIGELLLKAQTDEPWDEVTLQSITNEKLISALNPLLLGALQGLRKPGGELVGLNTFLAVIRKHLLQGTMSEFDPQFYLEMYESQKFQDFAVFEEPANEEYSERFNIKFLTNPEYTFQNNKNGDWGNSMIGRMRPLNTDLNITVDAKKLDGETVEVTVPDDGIPVDKLTDTTLSAPPSVGSADTVNIGIGGGFYISATLTNGDGEAVVTNNIVDRAYFANPPARAKALSLLDVDTSIKIRAESLANKHEYYAGDTGASATKVLYFGLNLGSVSGEPTDNVLIESYSATYSLIEDSSQIAEHFNNNALAVPVMTLDYRDPLYRYILDTSTLSATLNDFTLVGFRDKAFTELDSKFIRNIPFGFIVTPVAGSRYNPFYGQSNLISYGTTHVREISMNSNLSPTIDGFEEVPFETYNLYNTDGSKRIGLAEPEHFENFGYVYDPTIFEQTFFNGEEYVSGLTPASSYGIGYLVKDVMDYLQATYDPSKITWYDVFSRMPISRMGEVFYENTNNFLEDLANGYRNSITIDNVESGYLGSVRVLDDDAKTIVTKQDRANVATFKR